MKFVGRIIVLCVCVLVIVQMSFAQEEYKLGVLTPKGADVAKTEWQPTVEYLSKQTGKTFSLVPLRLKSFEPAVKGGKMDFVLCNSAVFSQIQESYGVKPLASMVNIYQGKPLRGYGAVIFTLADSNIHTLSDLKGKKVAALQKNALMGYQLQVYILKKKGIEPGKDFEVSFAGKLPLVVKAVKSKAVDAGFAGAGMLGWLEEQAGIPASDFKVIEPESDDFPYQHNGPILPYWVFGAAKDTDAALADEVAAALKAMPADSPAAKAANIYGWEDLADLAPVREVLQNIQ